MCEESQVATAYFIQDYEADFDNLSDVLRDKALDSYTRVDDMVLFAKTAWLRRKVEERHGVAVHAVSGSVDLSAFDSARVELEARAPPRAPNAAGDVVRVVAMLRPSTPRRNPDGTLAVLDALRAAWGPRVELHTFGCGPDELEAFLAAWRAPAALRNALAHHGTLRRPGVAALFAASDVFVDMSHWQAWGRTGLEAMAAGCVPVLPAGSGSEEYADHDGNAKLTNTSDFRDAVAAVSHLVRDRAHRRALRAKGIWTAGDFDLATASLTLLRLFCDRLDGDAYRAILTPSVCLTDAGLDLAEDSAERDRRRDRTAAALEAARAAESRAGRARAAGATVRAKIRRRDAQRRRAGGYTALRRAPRRPVPS